LAEIAGGVVEGIYAMGEAESGDTRIVNFGSGVLGTAGDGGQLGKVGFAIGKEEQGRTCQPILQKDKRGSDLRRRAANARMTSRGTDGGIMSTWSDSYTSRLRCHFSNRTLRTASLHRRARIGADS
jgi:hypothetical protein